MRRRFWLWMMDAAHWFHHRHDREWTWSLYLWAVNKASAATDWGESATCDGDEPF